MNHIVLRVVVSYQCNQRCSFCYQCRRDGDFLDLNQFERVLDGQPAFSPQFVTIQGGEPTLYPDLPRMVARLRLRYPGAFLSVTTNGTAPLDLYRKLDARGLNNLTFSLHTLDPRRHAALTRQCPQELREYLAKILEFRQHARAFVRINAYIFPGEVPAIYNFCKNNDLKLTFCEDLVSRSNAARQRLELPAGTHLIAESPLRRIYVDRDGFEVWNYKFVESFDYDNFIVLPDGSVTEDFGDVISQRGIPSDYTITGQVIS